jgi:hypothetical protein
MRIELHIEELLLDGFDPRDRYRIADQIEQSLARTLSDANAGFASRSQNIDRLDAGALALKRNAPAREVGSSVARAIAGVLDGGSQ